MTKPLHIGVVACWRRARALLPHDMQRSSALLGRHIIRRSRCTPTAWANICRPSSVTTGRAWPSSCFPRRESSSSSAARTSFSLRTTPFTGRLPRWRHLATALAAHCQRGRQLGPRAWISPPGDPRRPLSNGSPGLSRGTKGMWHWLPDSVTTGPSPYRTGSIFDELVNGVFALRIPSASLAASSAG